MLIPESLKWLRRHEDGSHWSGSTPGSRIDPIPRRLFRSSGLAPWRSRRSAARSPSEQRGRSGRWSDHPSDAAERGRGPAPRTPRPRPRRTGTRREVGVDPVPKRVQHSGGAEFDGSHNDSIAIPSAHRCSRSTSRPRRLPSGRPIERSTKSRRRGITVRPSSSSPTTLTTRFPSRTTSPCWRKDGSPEISGATRSDRTI